MKIAKRRNRLVESKMDIARVTSAEIAAIAEISNINRAKEVSAEGQILTGD